jgi:hypothetical protein
MTSTPVGRATKKVEREAMEFVLSWERKQGRKPRVIHRKGPDIISSRRRIEVKGKGKDVWDRSLIRPLA